MENNLLPQYVYDPKTMKYTLVQPGLGALELQNPAIDQTDSGGGGIGPSGPGGAFTDAFGHPTEMGVSFGVGAQNLGNALAPVSMFSPTLGVIGQVSSNIGNSIMNSQVSPVANPVAPTETAISPTVGLAAMNAQTAAENQTAVGPTGVNAVDASVAQAVADFADTTDAEAGATVGAPAGGEDSGGPSGDAGVSGAANEGSHAADGNDSGTGATGGPSGDPSDAGDSDDDSYYRGGRIPQYANGGLAAYGAPMNSANFMNEIRYQDGGMAQTAQMMANQGRMGDNMMVHMNPMEVAGLQALARSQGTSMTTNPQTGMPEAFSLKALLPALAGVALGPAGIGLTAAQAGLAAGAAGTLATGSLKKGLMAGLGAYGGAGLTEGLAGAASQTPPGMEGAAGSGLTAQSAIPAPAAPGAFPGGTNPYGFGGTGPLPAQGEPIMGGLNIPPAPQDSLALAGTPPAPGVSISPQLGAQTLPGPTPGPFDAMSGKDMFKYGYSALAGSSGFAQPEPGEQGYTPYARPQYQYSFETGRYERMPDRVMAAGGLAAFKKGGKTKRSLTGSAPYDFQGRDETLLQSVEKNFAKGGRFLVGNGDGMSDDIPAMIADKQPARLADGEFVIPADVVSHLGNGSSKAGAEKLHEMMNRIRKERTGREKQAPAVKATKYMPA